MFGLVNNTPNVLRKAPQEPKKINKNSDSTENVNKSSDSTETVNKMNIFYKLLETICTMLDDNQIPFYLDCGTLLGCIREKRLLLNDTDIDITIHLSRWEKLTNVDYSKYGLVLKINYNGFPHYYSGNYMCLYLEDESPDYYCDIYANPAFPILTVGEMGNNLYPVPKEPELYLKQLYGNWMVPSDGHADAVYHRNNGLIFSDYKKNWDLRYNIYKCNF